jgi:5-formyltetrahydrofolate cyclo-ligase
MTTDPVEEILSRKRTIRREAGVRRREVPDKDERSRAIWERLAGLPQYARAATVMLYLDFNSEARTRPFVPEIWQSGRRVVVPYCVEDRLGLFRLCDFAELAPGTLGILEPAEAWRGRPDRHVAPEEIDLVVVPGVAFDRRGGRIGHGMGYYDRFLRRLRPDAWSIAPAFECQLFDEVPLLPHDVGVDRIVTECAVYCRAAPWSRPADDGWLRGGCGGMG